MPASPDRRARAAERALSEVAKRLRAGLAGGDLRAAASDALTLIAGQRSSNTGGRPRRAGVRDEQLPVPDLAGTVADVRRWLTGRPSPEVLEAALQQERERDRRVSVLAALADALVAARQATSQAEQANLAREERVPMEDRLYPEPRTGWAETSDADALAEIASGDRDFAAAVYRWEVTVRSEGGRLGTPRPRLLAAAAEAYRQHVLAERGDPSNAAGVDSPSDTETMPLPWPGYELLVTSASGRVLIRPELARHSASELRAAVAYEEATRRRGEMLRALRPALDRAERYERLRAEDAAE